MLHNSSSAFSTSLWSVFHLLYAVKVHKMYYYCTCKA